MSERIEGEHHRPESDPGFTHPRIYVASLADYNAGRLHGQWLDATQPAAVLLEHVKAMLDRSPLCVHGEEIEEWAIHDSDGFGSLRIGEHADLATVSQHARAIAEHGLAYAAWWEENGIGTPETFLDDEYASMREYVEELGQECGWDSLLDEVVPKSLRPYVRIDYELLAQDMSWNGEAYALPTGNGTVWVFHG